MPALTLQAAIRDMELEESLCCTSHALYNLLRSYPQTLFGDHVPSYEEFARGLAKMGAVGGDMPAHFGLTDRVLAGVAAGLGLKGEAIAVPRAEAEFKKRLAAPGTGFLGRLTLREAAGNSAGARHSVVVLPVDPDREMPHYNAMDSNGAVGAVTKYAWKELSRMLCGLFLLEVHGPRRELGNTVAGFGMTVDLERRTRDPDVRDLLKVLSEFASNPAPVLGSEFLAMSLKSHPRSVLLNAFRAGLTAAMALKGEGSGGKGGAREDLEEARRQFEEALALQPDLARAPLPDALRSAHWEGMVDALAALAALSASPKTASAELREKVKGFLTAGLPQDARPR